MTGNERMIPPLRPDLIWEEASPDSPFVHLVDRRLGRSLRVDRRGQALAMLMDHHQTDGELLSRFAAAHPPMTPEALQRVINSFTGLGLLESPLVEQLVDERNEMRARYQADPNAVPFLIPDGLRFSCSLCGSCCTGVNVGPVTEDVVIEDRIEELARTRPYKRSMFFSMFSDKTENDVLICESRNGSCIFLDAKGLCEIHGRWGEAAKPRVCRLFPFQFVLTPKGIAVGLQMECRDILKASRGQLLSEQTEGLRQLIRIAPQLPVVRPFVSLDGVGTLSYDTYEQLEQDIVSLMAVAPETGFDLLIRLSNVVQEVFAQAGRPFGATVNGGEDVGQDLYGLLLEIGEGLAVLKERNRPENAQKMRFHTSNLDMLIETLTDVPLFADRILASDEQDDGARLCRMLAASAWESKDVLCAPDIVSGMAMHHLHWFLTRAVAVSRARQMQRVFLEPRDLVDASVAMHLVMRNQQVKRMLHQHIDRIARVFVHHLPFLVQQRNAIVKVDPRTDFYVF